MGVQVVHQQQGALTPILQKQKEQGKAAQQAVGFEGKGFGGERRQQGVFRKPESGPGQKGKQFCPDRIVFQKRRRLRGQALRGGVPRDPAPCQPAVGREHFWIIPLRCSGQIEPVGGVKGPQPVLQFRVGMKDVMVDAGPGKDQRPASPGIFVKIFLRDGKVIHGKAVSVPDAVRSEKDFKRAGARGGGRIVGETASSGPGVRHARVGGPHIVGQKGEGAAQIGFAGTVGPVENAGFQIKTAAVSDRVLRVLSVAAGEQGQGYTVPE